MQAPRDSSASAPLQRDEPLKGKGLGVLIHPKPQNIQPRSGKKGIDMPRKNSTKRLQPRTDREQLLVDAIVDHHLPASELNPRTSRERRIVVETVRDADQIRAARSNCRDRVTLISPYYSAEKKAAARARLGGDRR